MPFPSYLLPNVIQPQTTLPPTIGDALKLRQAQEWYRRLGVPFQDGPGPGGLLDRFPYRVPLGMQPSQGLLQRAAEIIDLKKRLGQGGLLGAEMGSRGSPYAGGGGPRVGSPEWVQAYEAQQGLRPGSLQPVERAPADVTRLPQGITPELRARRVVMERNARAALDEPSAKQRGQLERNKASAEAFKGQGPDYAFFHDILKKSGFRTIDARERFMATDAGRFWMAAQQQRLSQGLSVIPPGGER